MRIKKIVVKVLPYLLLFLLFTKVGQAIRLTPGVEFSEKVLRMQAGFTAGVLQLDAECSAERSAVWRDRSRRGLARGICERQERTQNIEKVKNTAARAGGRRKTSVPLSIGRFPKTLSSRRLSA